MNLADLAMQLRISTPTKPREYQTCPECSFTRSKPKQKCLKVLSTPEGIRAMCFHCQIEMFAEWPTEEAAA